MKHKFQITCASPFLAMDYMDHLRWFRNNQNCKIVWGTKDPKVITITTDTPYTIILNLLERHLRDNSLKCSKRGLEWLKYWKQL